MAETCSRRRRAPGGESSSPPPRAPARVVEGDLRRVEEGGLGVEMSSRRRRSSRAARRGGSGSDPTQLRAGCIGLGPWRSREASSRDARPPRGGRSQPGGASPAGPACARPTRDGCDVCAELRSDRKNPTTIQESAPTMRTRTPVASLQPPYGEESGRRKHRRRCRARLAWRRSRRRRPALQGPAIRYEGRFRRTFRWEAETALFPSTKVR